MDELIQVSATELARRIRSGECTSEEVVRVHLDRIATVNPLINAVVQVPEDAMDRARGADGCARRGQWTGPLHGVPFTVKDVVDVTGLVSAAGVPERRERVPGEDATVVARLKAAGGIVIGWHG